MTGELSEKTSIALGKEAKYLTFALKEEVYGLEILKVREIMGVMNITHIPQMPEHVLGVINLRGKVIPIIDLRLRFGFSQIGFTDRTCIIVVEIKKAGASTVMGILVDSVSEVISITPDSIEEPPVFGDDFNTDFILGIAKMEENVIILLDINKILSPEEVEALKQAC